MTRLPLAGIKVLEIAQGVAGPFCGRTLSAMGATVVKLEQPPKGDWSRSIGPFADGVESLENSTLFLYNNMGKKSVLFDFESKDSILRINHMLKDFDILLEDFDVRFRIDKDLDVNYFVGNHRDLIEINLTPFGLSGPYARWKSTPLVQLALGGYLTLTGFSDREPLMLPGYQPDYLTGMNAYNAVQIALLERDTTGFGQFIEMSMLETLANLHQYPLHMGNGLRIRNGNKPARFCGLEDLLCGLTTVPAGDGYVTFAAGSEEVWSLLCVMIEEDGTKDKVQSDGFKGTAEHCEEADRALVDWMRERTKLQVFHEANEGWSIPVAPILTLEEVLSDPQYVHRGLFQNTAHPTLKNLTFPKISFTSSSGIGPVSRPPTLGEHTEDYIQ